MKELPVLNLPIYELKMRIVKEKKQIFDVVRKKYYQLTPEEWVRQNFIHYLNKEKNYPLGLIAVEKKLKNKIKDIRADIVLYDTHNNANIIVECKAPNINISQDIFYQIAKYNFILRSQFLIVTNGIKHFCCKMDYQRNTYDFIAEIPNYVES